MLLGLDASVAGKLITLQLRDLRFGGFSFRGAAEPDPIFSRFIDLAAASDEDIIVDLRDPQERAPVAASVRAVRVSAESFEQTSAAWPRERRIVLCCRTGLRAWRAARALQGQGYQKLALVALGP